MSMTREEIRNTIFTYFKSRVEWIEANPRQMQQFQIANVCSLFPYTQGEPSWSRQEVVSTVREIVQELINDGFLYIGTASESSEGFPWITITQYGKEAFLKEDWLPYDPDGYINELKIRVPSIDTITLIYAGEAVAAYNRRHLLSATITLGVASENMMLLLIEAYGVWLQDVSRKTRFLKKIQDKFISKQYTEFKKELSSDIGSFPNNLRGDWETYFDTIFNFIRLNRNDAGHPTGKQLDVKVVYANLQIFSEYSQFIFKFIDYLK